MHKIKDQWIVTIRRHWSLGVVIAVSATLSSWALGTVGWGNTYYSAAVRSMSESWHAFWFGALDTRGFVTVDKPPMSMWIQALAVRVFGFHSLTLLIPQVLAGVGAVVLVYVLIAPRWGRVGATIGALALAISPISVMVNHSNNTDAILIFFMTAVVYAGVRATESGKWKWWVATGLLFGAAFTTKMLAAAPVLVAVAVAFGLASKLTWKKRSLMLVGGLAIATVSALAWFTFVDLTPKDQRPYVGSSATNSAYQLAFERNGVNQVEGDMGVLGGPSGAAPDGGSFEGPPTGVGGRSDRQGAMPEDFSIYGQPPAGFVPGEEMQFPPMGFEGEMPPGFAGELPDGSGGELPSRVDGYGDMSQTENIAVPIDRGGGMLGIANGMTGFSGGSPGILRLLNADLGTQIGWLVVPGILGLLAALWVRRRRIFGDALILAASVWFLSGAAIFSMTKGVVHPYYVASIVPPLAILIGAGTGVVRDLWNSRWTLAVLGGGIAASGATTAVIARRTSWDIATQCSIAVAILGALLLVVGVLGRWKLGPRIAGLVLATLLVPAVWTMGSLKAGLNANLPYASPVTTSFGGARLMGRTNFSNDDSAVTKYLVAHRENEKWLVATPSAMTAGQIIIDTGEAVMALGGFSGGDVILDDAAWDELVAAGEVRYALLQNGAGPGGGSGLIAHIEETCTVVSEISDSLYDCAV